MRTALRRWPRIAAALLLGAGLGLTAAPAQAGQQAPPRTSAVQAFKNGESLNCLDYSYRYSARTMPCWGNDWQKWDVQGLGNGYFLLKNVATGQCLKETLAGAVDGEPCTVHDNDYQWRSLYLHGYVLLINKSTGGCMSDSGGDAWVVDCNLPSGRTDAVWY
ncbi:RICIN domain-containing protein [Streptomyces sp. NPDC050636]|uniref:RICIN domain-containing protein n=1 Tax=Streptomyces sp. NPDC050636 TaxID=3154510 RepID=UPI00341C4B3B